MTMSVKPQVGHLIDQCVRGRQLSAVISLAAENDFGRLLTHLLQNLVQTRSACSEAT